MKSIELLSAFIHSKFSPHSLFMIIDILLEEFLSFLVQFCPLYQIRESVVNLFLSVWGKVKGGILFLRSRMNRWW